MIFIHLSVNYVGPVIDEKEESRDIANDIFHPGSPDLTADGYTRFIMSDVLYPDDVYDFESITVANPGSATADDITIQPFTAKQKLNGVDLDKTWDHVRSHRNSVLEA